MDDDKHNEHEEPRLVISDLRHSRSLDDKPEPDDEPQAGPAEPVVIADPPEPVKAPDGPQIIELDAARRDAPMPEEVAPPLEQPGPAVASDEGGADFSPEAQIKQLFGAGISTYLLSQLDLLFNFALIYLGRVPNPATNLVSTDLDNARIAIDVLEFTLGHLKDVLPAAEQSKITQAVNEIKLVYMQTAANQPAEPEAPEGEA